MRAVRRLAVVALALAPFAVAVPTASATYHEMYVREIDPGSAAQKDAEYVELQMWNSGQNFVEKHVIKFFDATGTAVGSAKFPSDVQRGANQSTIVAATPAAESTFGIAADLSLTPNMMEPDGGAVCWENLDCVSWGSFSGSLPSTAGKPAPAIPDGMALRRKIAPGCATLLEASDDTDNSAADFEAVFPGPRPNSVVPTEHACGGGPGPGGGSSAPQTTLRRKPSRKTRDRTPTFRFSSDANGAGFECRLDRKAFRSCRSPFTAHRLAFGAHTFKIRAVLGDLADSSPATFSFRVLRKKHR